jgi:CO/xanthine dehydrogenase Mo-binding subunit
MIATKLSRRTLLSAAAGAGACLVLGFRCEADSVVTNISAGGPSKAKFASSAFISIDGDGVATLTIPAPDMGQGARTVLSIILAEELGIDWKDIRVEQADGNSEKFGRQGVGGSATVRTWFTPMRTVSATAASMLCHAASQKLNCAAAEIELDSGHAFHKGTGQKVPIGDLVAIAATMPTTEISGIVPRSAGSWKLIGKPKHRVDNLDVVTGAAKFGLDTRIEGMKFACIIRSRPFRGKVASFDAGPAKSVEGFIDAFPCRSGVAVVGETTWAALKAADQIKVTYDNGPDEAVSSKSLDAAMRAAIIDFPAATLTGGKTVNATYELPYLSHATMEPQNCTAVVTPTSCEVWVPTQSPDGARGEAANASGLDESQVTAHVTLAGGGFGRRLSTEYVGECVEIAKHVGKPIQLIWTRTDDLQHDHYRQLTYHSFRGTVDADGNPTSIHHQQVGTQGGRRRRGADGATAGPQWGRGGSSYKIGDVQNYTTSVPSPVPTGAWRSVDNTFLGFVNECFFDELCAAGGKDPLKARLELLHDDRTRACVARAGELGDWGKPLPPGRGRGVACFKGFNDTSVAHVVEVDCSGKEIKVVKMVAVVDCGLAVNPMGVEAQAQGAFMDGLSTTLHAAITIDGGGVVETNWDGFEWARMVDCPEMHIEIIGKGEVPGGMGEPGVPSSSPAIANAIFAATGKRVRKLPVKLADLT